MNDTRRLVDAGFNRAREGLRVLEDLARFVLEQPRMVEGLKQIRHQLSGASRSWPGPPLVLSRDAAGDVGTAISTPEEGLRRDLRAVAAAAGRRATEALRSLEEIAKVDAPDQAAVLESLRYLAYDLAGEVEQALPDRTPPQWRLCLILTEASCRQDWSTVARVSIEAGVDCIQIREKHLTTVDLVARTRAVRELVGDQPVDVIVNDRVDVALAAGATGVHVGAADLTVGQVRAIAGGELLVGATVRSSEDVVRAMAAGASSCGIGPMFTSETKPELTAAGPQRLRSLLPALQGRPHLAIGGIDERTITAVLEAGAKGVAVCHAICGAADPAAAAGRLLDQIPHPNAGETVGA